MSWSTLEERPQINLSWQNFNVENSNFSVVKHECCWSLLSCNVRNRVLVSVELKNSECLWRCIAQLYRTENITTYQISHFHVLNFSKTCLTITYPISIPPAHCQSGHCMWNRHILLLEPRNIETLQRHFRHWSYLVRNFKIRTLFQSKKLQQQAQIICQNVCL